MTPSKTGRADGDVEALPQKEEVGRQIAEAEVLWAGTPDPVLFFDSSGRVARANQAAISLCPPGPFGLDGEGLIHRASLRHPDGTPAAVEDLPSTRALRGETVWDERFLVAGAPGREALFSASAWPVASGGATVGAVVLGRDMTAVRVLEEQRDELLRVVSHDLRSPLVGIGGFAQLMRRHLEESGARDPLRYLEFILAGTRQMGAIIQEIVDSTRAEAGLLVLDKESVGLSDFVPGLLARAAEGLDAARVEIDLPTGLPAVFADPNRLELILTNLLTSALMQSPHGAGVLLTAARAGAGVVISVIGRGEGMTSVDLQRQFERSSRAIGGGGPAIVGRSLHSARMLVEAHGGRIWAEREAYRGIALRFTLPIARP